MRAKAVIVASGAYEQPAVFRNNDLPGVMLASAAQRLIYRYAVKPMNRAVVLVANQDGYRAAIDLAIHGVTVVAVVELHENYTRNHLTEALQDRGIPIFSVIVCTKPNSILLAMVCVLLSSVHLMQTVNRKPNLNKRSPAMALL
jgi:NADPH-dependent 2,4-dienoyl-CoA reductase/sulfur reductase-like enzyme